MRDALTSTRRPFRGFEAHVLALRLAGATVAECGEPEGAGGFEIVAVAVADEPGEAALVRHQGEPGMTSTQGTERAADPWWTASMLLPSGSNRKAA